MEEAKAGTTAPAVKGAAEAKATKWLCEVACYDGRKLYREQQIYEFPAGEKPFVEDYFKKL